MSFDRLPLIKQGSVKNILGPLPDQPSTILFQFSNAFSAFDWGRMPDAIPFKGAALAITTAEIFSQMTRPETWKEFSKTKTALEIRKGIAAVPSMHDSKSLPAGVTPPDSLSSIFNEMGEELQREGMPSHFLGVADPQSGQPLALNQVTEVFDAIAVGKVDVVKPLLKSFMGRPVLDYQPVRQLRPPKLVPLEVVFRFSCPPGSSLLKVVEQNPGYLQSLGLPPSMQGPLQAGAKWTYPLVEFTTKLESKDRRLSFTEALAISGLSSEVMQEVILRTIWVAGFLKERCSSLGLELADGKLEWGLDANNRIILVDSIGPDELRLLKQGRQLSKEFLRRWYRKTPWHSKLEKAQETGAADWKKRVTDEPPPLPPNYLEAASQLYQVLANEMTGKKWFKQAWTLDDLVARVGKLEGDA